MSLLCIFVILDCLIETTYEEPCIQFSSFFTQRFNEIGNSIQNFSMQKIVMSINSSKRAKMF